MIRKRHRLNESSGTVTLWKTGELNGTMTAEFLTRDDVLVRLSITGDEKSYNVDIQMRIERDWFGINKNPYWTSVLKRPRKFNSLTDAVEFATKKYTDKVSAFLYSIEDIEEEENED